MNISKLSEIFGQSMNSIHSVLERSVNEAICRLDLELPAQVILPLKDQELWDQLVGSLQVLGAINMSELLELNQLRTQWCELCEVWDQLLPEREEAEIIELANRVLQNCPQERAWVRLWNVLNRCYE